MRFPLTASRFPDDAADDLSGGAALPLVERLAVGEMGWILPQDFAAAVACGYLTPGPVLITATFVGNRSAGLGRAVNGRI